MAKLFIYRGETLHAERDLTEQKLRIGRGAQNDIVLEDPGKGVSRDHAELRFEGGRYKLVDLQSQNGIWVSGTRVSSVFLDPEVIAAVGPYRLTIKVPAQAPAPPPYETDPSTELTQLSERSAAPLVLDSLGPPPAEPAPSLPPPPAAAPAPPPLVQERPRSQPAADQPWYSDARIWVAAGVAILLLGSAGIVGYRMTHRRQQPVWNADIAQSLIASGRCQEALDTQINPALTQDPNNQEALKLRDGCTRPASSTTSTTTTIPPTPTADERLTEAEGLLTAKDCPKALEVVNGVIAEDPNNERAKALFAKVNACINPAPTTAPPTERAAVAVSPSQGGLELVPGETDRAYKARIATMKKKYEEALGVLNSQRYLQAARLLDELAQSVPAGYLDLAQRREEARNGARAEAKAAFDAGAAAESKNDYDAAIDQYRRAHQLDPSLPTDAAIQRVTDRRIAVGRKRCNDGQLEFTYGNNAAAITAFQDAVRLLPQSDPCYAIARQRLQQLGK